MQQKSSMNFCSYRNDHCVIVPVKVDRFQFISIEHLKLVDNQLVIEMMSAKVKKVLRSVNGVNGICATLNTQASAQIRKRNKEQAERNRPKRGNIEICIEFTNLRLFLSLFLFAEPVAWSLFFFCL